MEEKARGWILPFILILLGIALLLDQLGILYLNWGSVLRLWPLLLVFVGLQIVLHRTQRGNLASLILAGLFVAAIAVFAFLGGPSRKQAASQTLNYPLRGLQAATVQIETGMGKLYVAPLKESGDLYEAQIEYDKGRTALTYTVKLQGAEARVQVVGKQYGGMPFGGSVPEVWQVGLSNRLPLRLEVNTGVGQSELDLAGLRLSQLDLNAGVGSTEVLLPAEGNYGVVIKSGVGALTVEIPQGLEAQIRVTKGLGKVNVDERFIPKSSNTYMTQDYEKAKDKKIELRISGGVGSITVQSGM